MVDAEAATALLLRIQADIRERYEVEAVPHDLLTKLQRCPRKSLPQAVQRYFQSLCE
jgi:hypothetical protein